MPHLMCRVPLMCVVVVVIYSVNGVCAAAADQLALTL